MILHITPGKRVELISGMMSVTIPFLFPGGKETDCTSSLCRDAKSYIDVRRPDRVR